MPGASSPRPAAVSRRGWTLIELLLAVVITLMVITLLYTAYHTVLTATRGQTRRLQHAEAGRAVNQLSRELQAAFLPKDDTNCVMRLTENNGIQLEWCATLLGPQENDLRWVDITHIRYLTVTNGSDVILRRESLPLTGPSALLPPVTNHLAHGIQHIRVRFFDGDAWQATWPVTDTPELPHAARIELRSGSPHDPVIITTEIFIPAGSVVSPHPP